MCLSHPAESATEAISLALHSVSMLLKYVSEIYVEILRKRDRILDIIKHLKLVINLKDLGFPALVKTKTSCVIMLSTTMEQ